MKYLSELLKSESSRLGLQLEAEHIRKFEVYLTQLKEWNNKFNLTAITKEEEIVSKHFIDSLACLLSIPQSFFVHPGSLLDIGSGAGFPGLPLKIYRPAFRLTLLEASQKKAGFLQHICAQLSLQGVEILVGRAEEYGQKNPWRGNYDVVVARAVDTLAVLVEYALPFLKEGGIFIAQKGSDISKELQKATMAIKVTGGAIKEIRGYEVQLGTDRSRRNLVVIEKVAATPAKYPRRVGAPKKRPIK